MDLALKCELAELLTTLRPEGRQHSGLDVRLVPPDKHTAQSIAQMAAEELGWPIAGWKIAAIKPDMQKALRTASPIYGRVFAPMVKASPLSVVHAKLCSPIPEVEYEARLASDLPPHAEPYTIEEVTGTLVRAHFWNVPVRRSPP
jgi:2-keto-4-pentenoate hydratase